MKAAAIAIFVAAVILSAQAMRSTWDGVYTNEQADRGDARYGPLCAECHGDDLGGDIVENPELAGGTFRDKWNGLNVGQLFERVHRDMPAHRPGTLSRETATDLIAYILRENRYPAGSVPLSTDVNVLKLIRIDSQKPDHK
jgi:mono/diheme cytochrome c family protein